MDLPGIINVCMYVVNNFVSLFKVGVLLPFSFIPVCVYLCVFACVCAVLYVCVCMYVVY